MTVAEDILLLVTTRPGLTETQIAERLFGDEGYQQRVNSTCRRLIREYRIRRQGNGGPGDPFIYFRQRIVRKAP